MFSGIIVAIGEVRHVSQSGAGLRISIHPGMLDLSDVQTGDSVAVNGVCLTTVALAPNVVTMDVSRETLNCTTGFAEGDAVNLEKALKLGDRLSGHFVFGHVDGVGEVATCERDEDCVVLSVAAPPTLAKYLAQKGSIAVNGVSLTVNAVAGNIFRVNLIPHTLASTNLKLLKRGSRVNLEADMLARYVERFISL
ncbi:MAG: riboflavin synthase [Burkholderiales bacterium]